MSAYTPDVMHYSAILLVPYFHNLIGTLNCSFTIVTCYNGFQLTWNNVRQKRVDKL